MIDSKSLMVNFKGIFLSGNSTEDKDKITKVNINRYTGTTMGNDLFALDKDVSDFRQTAMPNTLSGSVLNARNVDAIVSLDSQGLDKELKVLLTRKADTNILGVINLEKIKQGLSYTAKKFTAGDPIKAEGIIENSTQSLITLIDDVSSKFLQAEGSHINSKIDNEWSIFKASLAKILADHSNNLEKSNEPEILDHFHLTEDAIAESLNKISDTILKTTAMVNRSSGINTPDPDLEAAAISVIDNITSDWKTFTSQLEEHLQKHTTAINSMSSSDITKISWKNHSYAILNNFAWLGSGIKNATNFIQENTLPHPITKEINEMLNMKSQNVSFKGLHLQGETLTEKRYTTAEAINNYTHSHAGQELYASDEGVLNHYINSLPIPSKIVASTKIDATVRFVDARDENDSFVQVTMRDVANSTGIGTIRFKNTASKNLSYFVEDNKGKLVEQGSGIKSNGAAIVKLIDDATSRLMQTKAKNVADTFARNWELLKQNIDSSIVQLGSGNAEESQFKSLSDLTARIKQVDMNFRNAIKVIREPLGF